MNVLFVCTGNTCRSAMAEGILRKMLSEKNIPGVTVKSCGTDASPSFRVPPVVLKTMAACGIDMSRHRSTMITQELVDESGLILVMEEYHKKVVELKFPSSAGKTHLFKSYAGGEGSPEIPDPIGQSDEIYINTALELKKYSSKLAVKLERGK